MSILQRCANAQVLMYLNDHPPPHVHVRLRDGRECIVELNGFLIKGRVAGRELREALAWIETNRDFLFEQWLRFNP